MHAAPTDQDLARQLVPCCCPCLNHTSTGLPRQAANRCKRAACFSPPARRCLRPSSLFGGAHFALSLCSALLCVQVKVDDARRFEYQLLLTFERPLASGDSAQVSGGGGRVNETAECAAFFARVDAYAVQHAVSQCPASHPVMLAMRP